MLKDLFSKIAKRKPGRKAFDTGEHGRSEAADSGEHGAVPAFDPSKHNSELFYLDDDNNIVTEDKATHGRILVTDEQGRRVQEVYLVVNREEEDKEEEELVVSEEDQKILDSLEWRDPLQQYEYALAHNMIKPFEYEDDGYVDFTERHRPDK